eukprot:366338-Chlamydomonas_euryale.AAC.18
MPGLLSTPLCVDVDVRKTRRGLQHTRRHYSAYLGKFGLSRCEHHEGDVHHAPLGVQAVTSWQLASQLVWTTARCGNHQGGM